MSRAARSCGAAVLLAGRTSAGHGQPPKRAWYVHNLVTAVGASGAGKAILREAEKLAGSRGMEAMRLDCADDNTRLNAWYESQGYFPCGTCIDGPYHGILREKLL
ncbi:MAG: GNAT family N-acetyltransferase [Oscillospiraceae bacterium]